MSPVIRQPSTRSFIRFRLLRNVDLPQPEGPINAVISSDAIFEVDVFERMETAVIQFHVFDGKLHRPSGFIPCLSSIILRNCREEPES